MAAAPNQATLSSSEQKEREAQTSRQPPAYEPTTRQVLPPISGATNPPSYDTPAIIQPQQFTPANQPQHNATSTQYQQPKPPTRQGWADGSAKVCGILQIIIGFGLFVLNIIGFVIDSYLHEVGVGMWCGIPILITGVLGVIAANKKTNGPIIAFMVMSIIMAVLCCIPVITVCAIGMSNDLDHNFDNNWGFYFRRDSISYQAKAAINGLMLVGGIAEVIVSIVSSVLCCRAVCCGYRSSPAPNQINVVYVHAVPTTIPGQYQQILFVPGQHGYTTGQGQIQQGYSPAAPVAVTHGQHVMYTNGFQGQQQYHHSQQQHTITAN